MTTIDSTTITARIRFILTGLRMFTLLTYRNYSKQLPCLHKMDDGWTQRQECSTEATTSQQTRRKCRNVTWWRRTEAGCFFR